MFDQIDLFRPKLPTTFGSAAWATISDLRRAKMLEPGRGSQMSPLIGCLTPAEIGGRDIVDLYVPGEGHLLTAAPTRSGKGYGQIITNLLWWPGSAVVIDIKGENWDRTAGWRQSAGHNVIRFAPFEQGSARWNPIDQINAGCGDKPNDPRRQENARYLANLMITPNPAAKDPYWDNAAKSLLQGLMLFVATAPLAEEDSEDPSHVRSRTMAEVRRLLTQNTSGFNATLGAMFDSPEDWVREAAGTMNQMAAAREQAASVKTVLMEHTAIWAYRRVQEATAVSEFSFQQLRDQFETHPEKSKYTTIYIVIPPEVLTEYRNLLRVMTGWCMRELRFNLSKAVDDERPPVLFFLDEFPQLAYMQPIEEALLYIGSYGVKFWFFIQDISQIQQHYEKTWRQFIANCAVRTFFGVSDIETAKIVSEMSGQGTTKNRSYQTGISETDTVSESTTTGSGSSHSTGPGGGSSGSSSHSSRTFTTSRAIGRSFNHTLAFVGRPLFMPDEVLRMPFGAMIALIKGMPAIRGQLRFWGEHETLASRGKIKAPS